ncbi:MAG: transketolase, partial [Candidatus Adiutrix sp.]|nr:transketolase [Candidatus Adiutrix sp.]
MDAQLLDKLRRLSLALRRNVLDMAHNCGGSAHLGGGLSEVDILAVLYGAVLKYNPADPEWTERDRFILSKGHGVLGYYAALAEAGFFPKSKLAEFQQNETDLGAHPVWKPRLGVESTNGSLGQGLSFGLGLALGARLKGLDHRVFVLLGNGECNEGAVWEAVMAAAQFRLGRLTAIVDDNGQQSDGPSPEIIGLSPLAGKFQSFGWRVIEADGHDHASLYAALSASPEPEKPLALVAGTV